MNDSTTKPRAAVQLDRSHALSPATLPVEPVGLHALAEAGVGNDKEVRVLSHDIE